MWTPKEIRKLITLISGLVFFCLGIYLMCNQIKADGSIDIKTTLLTGHIKSGSAGLFICFFAVVMLLISLLNNDFEVLKQLRNNKILILVLILLFIIVLISIGIYVPSIQYLVNVIVATMIWPIVTTVSSIIRN